LKPVKVEEKIEEKEATPSAEDLTDK